jgi:hypothetical protein
MSERIKTHEGASLKPPHHDPHLEHVGEAAILVLALLLALGAAYLRFRFTRSLVFRLTDPTATTRQRKRAFLFLYLLFPRGDRS